MDDSFAFLNPMAAELKLRKLGEIPTAQPATKEIRSSILDDASPSRSMLVNPPWWLNPSEAIDFWEGGTKGAKFVDEKGNFKAYLDTAAKNSNNISAVFEDPDKKRGFKGVMTIGNGWTFIPTNSGKVTEGMTITPEENKEWLRQSYKSFDEHLRKQYPQAWKNLTHEMKEGLYGYYHMMTGAMYPASQGKPAEQKWNTKTTTPNTHKILLDYTPDKKEELLKELSNTKSNPYRVRSVVHYMRDGELWDYSPESKGGKAYRLREKRKR